MSKYTIECLNDEPPSDCLISAWHRLLSESSSHEKIYQSPSYYEYLQRTNDGRDHIELLSISCASTGNIIGIVPLRFREQPISFGLGNKTIFSPRLSSIILLGSSPLLPPIPLLWEQVVDYIFAKFPSSSALSMPTLREEDSAFSIIKSIAVFNSGFKIHVLHGWRNSHVIPLPESFERYLQQFSAKKRFNINRQIRMLRENGQGILHLERIEHPEQVSKLVLARDEMATQTLIDKSISNEKYFALAQHGLLLSYILISGDQPVGVIMGTRSARTLHIHNILQDESLKRYSVGTSILHLAIEDLIKSLNYAFIDLGYSNPIHTYKSSNLTEQRGHVLLYRNTIRNKSLLLSHRLFETILHKIKKKLVNHRFLFKNKKSAENK